MRLTGASICRLDTDREGRTSALVLVHPVPARDGVCGVRSVAQHALGEGDVALVDRLDLVPDRDHRIAEPVQLVLVLRTRSAPP